jgi:hypothetical protein
MRRISPFSLGLLGLLAACVGDQVTNNPPINDGGTNDGTTSNDGGAPDGATTDANVDAGPPAAVGKVQWVRALPGADVTGVAVDKDGNTFACGSYVGTQVDFGAGKKLSSTKGRDTFVVKLDPAGNTLWAQSLGGTGGGLNVNDEYATGIAVDPAGDVYVGGWTDSGTMTFGPTTTTKDTNAFALTFMAKLGGSDGAARWIVGMSGTDDGITTRSVGVAASANAAYLLITFGGTKLKIDGGGTLANNDNPASGSGDWAIAAFEPTNHALLWANGIGMKGSDGAGSIALDGSGDPIIGGSFQTPPAAGSIVDTLGSMNIPRASGAKPTSLFARLSSQNGKQVWTKTFDATSSPMFANAVGAMPTGPVLLGGSFGAADFGKGPVTAQGPSDAWLVQLDQTSKASTVVKQIGGSANSSNAFESTLDLEGDVWGEFVAVGVHLSTDAKADGKPIAGPPTPNYRAAFIAKYDANANVLWAKGIASGSANDSVTATSVAILKSGDLRVGGTLSGTAALDGTTPVTAPAGGQGFVLGISP